jgi:hypothetical protein
VSPLRVRNVRGLGRAWVEPKMNKKLDRDHFRWIGWERRVRRAWSEGINK